VRALHRAEDMVRLRRAFMIIMPNTQLSDDEITELCRAYAADRRAHVRIGPDS